MLPPLLSTLRDSLAHMPAMNDAQRSLLAELEAINSGRPMPPAADNLSRSLDVVLDVCPLCQRPFGAP